MPTEWYGDKVIARVLHAAAEAIDEVTSETDHVASSSHDFRNQTGNLERRITTESAHRDGDEIVGSVGIEYAGGAPGVRDGFYGLFHESGTIHQEGRPFLRPAADATFPKLASKIKEKLR